MFTRVVGKVRRLLKSTCIRNRPARFHPLSDGEILWSKANNVARLPAEARVLVTWRGDRAWVLPWAMLVGPHVANLVLDDQQILITVCRACGTGMAFDSVLDGQPLTFQLAGNWNGASLLSDTATGSHWSPLTGEAIGGALKGNLLQPIPLIQCTWQEWVENDTTCLVAESKALAFEYLPKITVERELSAGFQRSLLRPLDSRLPKSTPVLGVWVGEVSRCYPLDALDSAGYCYNDNLGGTEIVLFHQPGTRLALAYGRRVGADLLEFSEHSGAIQDNNTGTIWNIQGQAVTGRLAGTRLRYVPSAVQEWYVWAANHPDTEIWTS